MSYETINFETPEKGLGILTLNRPASYNSVNYRMMEELEAFWNERLYDLDTRVIVLCGAGEKGFCSGLDLKDSAERAPGMGTPEVYRFQARLARLNLLMRRVPQPVITAVHGAAAGLGFSFMLASDIRVVAENARFSAAYINLGLGGADMACSYFLPRMIGAGRAYEFMYTGAFMTAKESMDLGLASRMVPAEKLMDTAMEYARILLGKNPLGLRLTKEAVNMNMDAGGLEQAISMEDRNQVLLVMDSMPRGSSPFVKK